MRILILLLALIISPLNFEEGHDIRLAMPHTHQVEKHEKIGKISRKYLQFVKNSL